ncbi:MAG: phage major capsid protein [Actinomycetota bacterium]|nr:phage major capsid protein [Actinomycetota bacterium]
MARQTFEDWIPEEWGGAVVTKIRAISAVESLARHEPMGTDTKHVPRSGGLTFVGAISKGAAYTEDTSTNDDVLLTARKLGVVMRVADEDLKDTTQVANIIETKKLDWARSYAIGFDHATLGVTAAENGTTIPFTSLYKALRTTNSDTSYTADANRIESAAGVALTYTNLSDLFGLVETGNFWADSEMVVIAHPAFRKSLRGILDTQNNPIFNESTAGVAGGGQGGPVSTVFGHRIRWSLGAKTHATSSDAPTGNPLMFVGNAQYLIVGDRSGPESIVAGADSGAAFLTDEALLKLRSRRGFAVGNEHAFAVLEDVA